jgi:hypothetical protein
MVISFVRSQMLQRVPEYMKFFRRDSDLAEYLNMECHELFKKIYPGYSILFYIDSKPGHPAELMFEFAPEPKTLSLAKLLPNKLLLYTLKVGDLEYSELPGRRMFFSLLRASAGEPAGELTLHELGKTIHQTFLKDSQDVCDISFAIGQYLEQLSADRQVALLRCLQTLFPPQDVCEFGILLSDMMDPVWRQKLSQEIELLDNAVA